MTESEDICKRRAISHLQDAIQLLELIAYLPVGRVINDIQIVKQDILELGGPETKQFWQKQTWRTIKRRAK